VLHTSGLLDAYESNQFYWHDYTLKGFLRNLCKKGLPEGDVFEYAALELEKY